MSSSGGSSENGRRKRSYPDCHIWAAQTIQSHAVQCAECGKYRPIPDKVLYESIRERIARVPWYCKDAAPWNSQASCEAADQFEGNSNFILTADRPGIPATPPGWERRVHIRAGPNGRQFSNIFYFAPQGSLSLTDRRMRSIKDIARLAKKHPSLLPDSVDDIGRQFSFATPAFPAQYEASSGKQSFASTSVNMSPTAWSSRSDVGFAEIATTGQGKEIYDPLQNTRILNVSENMMIAAYEAEAVKVNEQDMKFLTTSSSSTNPSNSGSDMDTSSGGSDADTSDEAISVG
ncbi:hypothetical protein AXG93_209s1310 [Marchantia polymorpha subsp. ruderalis]|uniref:CW-type domain-containing protein n=2 Tax=Marchantia polymorpha TaxID=3197 RepID=A0A176VJ24_MARPO|nr:hypothetical protein AXG93_209s1310 [Marchantia polymorpha subsp. ruderalis]